VKIAVVLNGISLAKDAFYRKYLPAIRKEFDVDVFETRSRNAAISIAAKLVPKRFSLIIAAGGDGTVNQVVNGMLDADNQGLTLPVLSVLPLGSGNDFAKSLAQDTSVNPFLNRIRSGKTREIDVGEILFSVSPPSDKESSIQETRYFVNVADVGMGPPVVRGVLASGRAFGSAVAYYKSILSTFLSYKPLFLHAIGDTWEWKSQMRTFAIANAKYYGNGLCIAPDAVLDDGIFDVFACGPVSVFDFIIQSIPLKKGKKLSHPQVSYFKSRQVRLNTPAAVEIEADGEIIGWLPATVRANSRRISILID
jgi:diacylglycerol kinase (ATP)